MQLQLSLACLHTNFLWNYIYFLYSWCTSVTLDPDYLFVRQIHSFHSSYLIILSSNRRAAGSAAQQREINVGKIQVSILRTIYFLGCFCLQGRNLVYRLILFLGRRINRLIVEGATVDKNKITKDSWSFENESLSLLEFYSRVEPFFPLISTLSLFSSNDQFYLLLCIVGEKMHFLPINH